MAYQKVGGSPRFYIDYLTYIDSLNLLRGYVHSDDLNVTGSPIGLDPCSPFIIEGEPDESNNNFSFSIDLKTKLSADFLDTINYVGYLGHSFGDRTNTPSQIAIRVDSTLKNDPDAGEGNHTWVGSLNQYEVQNPNIINSEFINIEDGLDRYTSIDESGFSLFEVKNHLSDSDISIDRFNFNFKEYDSTSIGNYNGKYSINSISIGRFYDMPVSPDLSLSMSVEYDGSKSIKTLSGKTISQSIYKGAPWWYDANGNKKEPWAIGDYEGISKRNGRRIWNLKFSYMSDKDLFASNYGSSTYMEESTGVDIENIDVHNFSSNIVTNGTFDADTHWHKGSSSTDWVIADGIASLDGTQDGWTALINNQNGASNALITGNSYRVEFNYTKSAGVVQFKTLSSHIDIGSDMEDEGSISLDFVAGADSWYITANASFVGNIDNVVIRAANPSDFQYTIDTDNSFSAQMLNKISHGEKFIFQPDNTANNPSDFAICVLDGDSFKMKRTAYNVYDIEMTIREVW